MATGIISSRLVKDLVLDRSDAPVKHIVQAIGSSSLDKAKEFALKYCPRSRPHPYDSYIQVYADPEVDVVYTGVPHVFHIQNCPDAIAASKPMLCEKAFTINKREADLVFEAARSKGVYVHEAMWLRHRPLIKELCRLLHEEKVIGDMVRVFADFGIEINIPILPAESRYKDPALGAGT